jgi:hypothetical protein
MEERIKKLEQSVQALEGRLRSHGNYVMHDILPLLDRIREDMDALWISNDRFTELERAVADMALTLYGREQVRRRTPADSRLRPRKKYARGH